MGNEASSDWSLGRRVSSTAATCCTLYDAVNRKRGPPLSVFVYGLTDESLIYVEHASKFMKVLRHPCLLTFHALTYTFTEPRDAWLVTERVSPLDTLLDSLTPCEICAGLYNIIDALAFLHDRGGFSHNSFSMASVFVASDGTWKLGGLECTSAFKEATSAFLLKRRKLRPDHTIAPEERSGELSAEPGYSRDVYAFGIFANYILEYLSCLGRVTERFQARIQEECLSIDPKKRPRLISLLDDELFRTDFVEICNFLKRITMKSSEEKKAFFTSLMRRLFSLPEELVASRLVRPLMSRFVVLEPLACECIMPHLLTPAPGEKRASTYNEGQLNPLLSEPLFRRSIIPELYKIFHVRDAHVRTVLLAHFHRYVRLFDGAMLAEEIFPEILLSLRDANDELVTLSLHAIADLVPILGGNIIIGADRVKLFSEGVPRFCTSDRIETKLNGSALTGSAQFEGSEAREAERQRKREESRRRMMERRKRNEESRRQSVTKSCSEDVEADAAVSPHDAHFSLERSDGISEATRAISPHFPESRGQHLLPNSDTAAYVNPTDSDIELEIESELIALESMSSPARAPKLELLSDDDDDHLKVIPVVVDWSDVGAQMASQTSKSAQRSIKGALKLASEPTIHSTLEDSPPAYSSQTLRMSEKNSDRLSDNYSKTSRSRKEISAKNDLKPETKAVRNAEKKPLPALQIADFDDWNEVAWEPVDTLTPVRSLSKKSTTDSRPTSDSSSSKYVRTTSNSGIAHRQNLPLGAEFDIMQLDIKTQPTQRKEFDFFADMAPQILPAEKGILGILNASSKSLLKGSSRADLEAVRAISEKDKGKSLFEVTQSGKMDEGDGWDAELNVTIEGM